MWGLVEDCFEGFMQSFKNFSVEVLTTTPFLSSSLQGATSRTSNFPFLKLTKRWILLQKRFGEYWLERTIVNAHLLFSLDRKSAYDVADKVDVQAKKFYDWCGFRIRMQSSKDFLQKRRDGTNILIVCCLASSITRFLISLKSPLTFPSH